MIYFSDAELDAFLLEDVYRGDITTRSLGIGNVPSKIVFNRKNSGRVAGVYIAQALLVKLGLDVTLFVDDGNDVKAGTTLIEAKGSGERIQQAWKVVQVILEWCCGVAQYTAEMVASVKSINQNAIVACTRKTIPGTRKLATVAVLAGGGRIHRAGLSESVLVFTNHRNLLENPEDWASQVSNIRRNNPEIKVTVEADNLEMVREQVLAKPDIIQLDKFSTNDVLAAQKIVEESGYPIQLSIAGGVNKSNVVEFARTGVPLFITSAPYYAGPDDIKVLITPELIKPMS